MKKVLSLLLIMSISLALCSCSGGAQTADNPVASRDLLNKFCGTWKLEYEVGRYEPKYDEKTGGYVEVLHDTYKSFYSYTFFEDGFCISSYHGSKPSFYLHKEKVDIDKDHSYISYRRLNNYSCGDAYWSVVGDYLKVEYVGDNANINTNTTKVQYYKYSFNEDATKLTIYAEKYIHGEDGKTVWTKVQ